MYENGIKSEQKYTKKQKNLQNVAKNHKRGQIHALCFGGLIHSFYSTHRTLLKFLGYSTRYV